MGREVSFKPENKVELYESFPRLKMEAKEKVLLSIHDAPRVVYVHTLRRPKLANGEPVMVTKVRKDKTTFEDNDMDFVSRPQCLGDETVLDERGSDPKNCPACAVAKKTSSVDAPQLRYAVHVFHYATKSGTHDLTEPFGGKVEVWTFTVKTFNSLIDVVKDTEKELKETDLMLECISKEFQSFDLRNSSKAMWMRNADNRKFVLTALESNRAKDLDGMCGRKMTREAIQDDLDGIEAAWRMANGQSDEISDADRASLQDSLKGVMSAAGMVPPEAAPASEPESSGDADSADTDDFAALLALKKK